MFTGIVEEVGRVSRFERRGSGARVTIDAERVTRGLREGDSVCVDGICLTVVAPAGRRFAAELSRETMERSTLGGCRAGMRVNLERPVRPDGRLGGHIVQGHVDGTATVLALRREGDHALLEAEVPVGLAPYLVPKGSVALNGVSLTVAELRGNRISIALIPTTLRETNLGERRRGDRLNLEVDIIGKYVRSFMAVGLEPPARSSIGGGTGEEGPDGSVR
jgi:riboflavin synthase